MKRNVLTLNAGSSSVKFALHACSARRIDSLLLEGQFERIGDKPRVALTLHGKPRQEFAMPAHADPRSCVEWLLRWLADNRLRFDAVAHRVVHGGTQFDGPVRIDAAVLAKLAALVGLAPLHQPHNLAGIQAVRDLVPGVPQFACFDTAFHRSQSDEVQMFALPRDLFAEGVRRYGFHGLSYEYISRQPELQPFRRVVVCHLGSGSSACAMVDGRSVDTTMGFTALDGLMMGTRCGSLDAGVIFHLVRLGLPPQEVESMLYKKSGLLGVSELSADMRDLLQAAGAGHVGAGQAVNMYCRSVAEHVARLATSIGGLDALVFTAGVGEHCAVIREQVAQRLKWMGVALDPHANEAGSKRISSADSQVAVWVLHTSEERMLCQHALGLLAQEPRAVAA
ncbi:acetate kinase [Burkholderiaceae bacterium]|nr:acetate kinase [Burkholderiaceae bacterium]